MLPTGLRRGAFTMSIQEHRRLVFGIPALREAVQIHMPDIAPSLVPRGAQVKSVVVVTEPLSARIRVMAQGAPEPSEVDLTALHLGAVLIRRCKALGIPLPRNARKSLEGDPSGVTMRVSLTHEVPAKSQLSAHRIGA